MRWKRLRNDGKYTRTTQEGLDVKWPEETNDMTWYAMLEKGRDSQRSIWSDSIPTREATYLIVNLVSDFFHSWRTGLCGISKSMWNVYCS